MVSTGCLTPVFPDYWSSPPVLRLQLHHSSVWDIVGETQKFSLILDLDEVNQLNWVRAVPFPAIQETRCAFVISLLLHI